jgi:hypothetical protein
MKKIIKLFMGRGCSDRPREIGCVKRTISDMESDGVYFSEEALRELELRRADMVCHYSGLPSVAQYAE